MATDKRPTPSVRPLPSGTDPMTVVIEIRGQIEPEHVSTLCDRVCNEVACIDAGTIVCELGDAIASDAVAVDALARLQLAARRAGKRVELRNASVELLELLELSGLAGVLPARDL